MADALSGNVAGIGTVQGNLTLVPLVLSAAATGTGTVRGNAVLRRQGTVNTGITRRGLVTEALPTND